MKEIEELIEYVFNDKEILRQALTHSSRGDLDSEGRRFDYERLEFIGDAMLDAMIGVILYQKIPQGREGDLSKLRAQIVCEESLNRLGHELEIGEYIRMGESEEKTAGRNKPSVTADVVEALIGGIFLDGGYEAANNFVTRFFADLVKEAIEGKLFRDYKTKMQETAQKNGWHIEYKSREVGPDHDKTFYVNLMINGKEKSRGTGKSKKEAEQKAAENYFEKGIQ